MKVKKLLKVIFCCIIDNKKSNQQYDSNIGSSQNISKSKKLTKKSDNSKSKEDTMEFGSLGDFGISSGEIITKNNEQQINILKQHNNEYADNNSSSAKSFSDNDSEYVGTYISNNLNEINEAPIIGDV